MNFLLKIIKFLISYKSLHAEHGRIEDFAFEERLCRAEFRNGSVFGNKLDLESVGLRERDGLFVAVEVVCGHARNMCLHRFIPHTVAVSG